MTQSRASSQGSSRPSLWQTVMEAFSCKVDSSVCSTSSCMGCKQGRDGSLFTFFGPLPWREGGSALEQADSESDSQDQDDEGLEWKPTTHIEGGARYTGQWR